MPGLGAGAGFPGLRAARRRRLLARRQRRHPDEYAARDDRVQVLHLPENAGLGPARNAGLARATGDYLLFLDSDDTLVPGALGALAERLAATAHPEILLFDYARTYWDGTTRRNTLSALLDESGAPSFPLTERPRLLDLLQIVWNKAYRRDFVEEHGFTFPPGYYEDAPGRSAR